MKWSTCSEVTLACWKNAFCISWRKRDLHCVESSFIMIPRKLARFLNRKSKQRSKCERVKYKAKKLRSEILRVNLPRSLRNPLPLFERTSWASYLEQIVASNVTILPRPGNNSLVSYFWIFPRVEFYIAMYGSHFFRNKTFSMILDRMPRYSSI